MKRLLFVAAALCAGLGAAVAALGWEASLGSLALTAPAGESLQVALAKSAAVLLGRFALAFLAPVLALTVAAWSLVERLLVRLEAR
jgi:hypothetical protein